MSRCFGVLVTLAVLPLLYGTAEARVTKRQAIEIGRRACSNVESDLVRTFGTKWKTRTKDWTVEWEDGALVVRGNDHDNWLTISISGTGKLLSTCEIVNVG